MITAIGQKADLAVVVGITAVTIHKLNFIGVCRNKRLVFDFLLRKNWVILVILHLPSDCSDISGTKESRKRNNTNFVHYSMKNEKVLYVEKSCSNERYGKASLYIKNHVTMFK